MHLLPARLGAAVIELARGPRWRVPDAATGTGRFDLGQELALPFALGPIKLVPYGTLDLTGYTKDLTGNALGRFYGGGGLDTRYDVYPISYALGALPPNAPSWGSNG